MPVAKTVACWRTCLFVKAYSLLSKPCSIFSLALLPLLVAGCGSGGGTAKPVTGSSSTSSVVSSPASSAASSSVVNLGLIKLNQVGFLPAASKLAVVPEVAATAFQLLDSDTHRVVYSGELTSAANWVPAQERVKLADFSGITEPGIYQLRVEGVEDSHSFPIGTEVYRDLAAASIKAFYYNRAGTALLSQHAGIYARQAGHPDTQVYVHGSAASQARPEGTVISSPKGWYDAGDYNKYIVNSGISTYTLLAAYEHFPLLFNEQNLNIPESNDDMPDLLDEILWNLEWMLTMQDPHDGGVYHKLTNKNFDGTVMPHQATSQRYVVQKTTAAALDFAAVMATASRVFAAYEAQRPGLAAQMREAAESAWAWAQTNPAVFYVQPADIRTGEYGDRSLADEFAWAAAELYITTGDDSYYTAMNAAGTENTVSSWGDVRGLAWISLAHHRDNLTDLADQDLIASRVTGLANSLHNTWQASAYRVSMQTNHFVWGSNSVALNQGIVLVQAYRLSGERRYLDAAQSMLDYVLGRNATNIAQVTGFGTRSTLHPHHRPSEADGIEAPIPGFVAGGPNPGQQDRSDCPVSYPSAVTARSYLDHYCSYASNEIAINWNAPLVYLVAAVQALTPVNP
ncbi:glycoside hydrolase family 9 protein [Cellvibrio japonicus]|uniref:Endoglucanase n=1 Tax=Cellvibrio japonicus (strain Ueda107) TaxID=498211 RepID=B3PEQ9_CELJU|nr:glycoside hydrolase family 9 protein [Cellvibrio japonicus]ACE85719.1 endo-1,4-beta glucanase, putative, cel9B [Cellvibrio japonicus Ueda107]QEI12163.1 cellulase [Cellvibrio japonicus]QEI15737.1 cellulase [Cellvibrio japonicus]QEI19315.1 cellulase [Cellvibrio japonicus]